MKSKVAHISIDDVWSSLKELSEKKYDTIFKVKLFKNLKSYNRKYNAKFTLYVYEKNKRGNYNIKDIPTKFKEEFKANSAWLKFGYHGIDETDNLNNINLNEFSTSFKNVKSAIINFSSRENLSEVLRLHYFSGEEKHIDYLYKSGVKILLCSDDKRMNYDLNKNENLEVQKKREIIKNKIKYCKTDIRLDNIKWLNINKKLDEFINNNEVIIFVHEWALYKKYYTLNKSLKWLNKNKYFFK